MCNELIVLTFEIVLTLDIKVEVRRRGLRKLTTFIPNNMTLLYIACINKGESWLIIDF